MKEYHAKPRQNGKTSELLRNIDVALARMEAKGHAETVHYARLKAKRDAIANGEPCVVIDVTPFLIAYIGTLIPDLNFDKDGNLIKARGNRKKAVIEAVMNIRKEEPKS